MVVQVWYQNTSSYVGWNPVFKSRMRSPEDMTSQDWLLLFIAFKRKKKKQNTLLRCRRNFPVRSPAWDIFCFPICTYLLLASWIADEVHLKSSSLSWPAAESFFLHLLCLAALKFWIETLITWTSALLNLSSSLVFMVIQTWSEDPWDIFYNISKCSYSFIEVLLCVINIYA